MAPEDTAEYAHEMAFPGTDQAMEKLARSLDREEILRHSTRFRGIKIPTLIFWGENDTITPFDVGRRLHAEIPGSILRSFPKCGHCPHMEYPVETLQETIRFLGSNIAATKSY